MIDIILAASLALNTGPTKLWHVCFDREIEFRGPAQDLADFMLAEIFDKTGQKIIHVYIGHHPRLKNKGEKFMGTDFKDKIKKPVSVYIDDVGMLGIHPKYEIPYFLIFGADKVDINWAATHIRFSDENNTCK